MQSKILRLKILTVSLKLKFKCRLKIQCTDGGATQEATTNNGLYDVDQELQLYPKKNEIELLLTLISEKGSSYNGGIVRTSIEQLRYSSGTAIKLTVSKCIDKQAWVEVKVISVPNLQDKENKKDLSFTDNREDGFFLKEAQYTPDRVKKGNLVLETNLGETRSEHGFPLPASSFKMAEDRKKIYETARPNFGQFSNVRMHKNRESHKISPFQSSPRRESPEQLHNRMEEQNRSRVQAERSASKLKRLQEKCKQEQQRVKQQQQKRKKVEYSEHNYKIELAKANIAKQEKQKQIAKKDSRIKELQSECARAKENAKKISQLKEELKAKEAQTKHLEDELDAERKLAQQWKSMAEEQSKKVGEQADKYRKLHDAIANEKNEAIQQLTKKMKTKDEEIAASLKKLASLQESNQRDKKNKQGVDVRTNEAKSQLEKVIMLLKKDLKQSKDQYSAFCLKTEQQKSLLNHELLALKDECDKLRMITSKATIQKRSLEQKIDDNQQKIVEMKRYREKYNEESNKYKIAKDQLSKLKRKHETIVEQNHKLEERLNLSLKNLEQLRKEIHSKDIKNIELEQRMKNLEEVSSENKILLQKQRKSQQLLQKECSQMREKEKQLKSQHSRKEIQLAKLKLELQNANQKIIQLKSAKQQQQQKTQPVVQQQEWENSKTNSILEVQRFLEMQLINSKQTIADLESSNARIKEQLQKWVRAEYQWRENERIWQAEKLRVSAQLAKSAKEVKDLTKRLAQEDARTMILNEKIEKEKKVSKSWQEKYFATEASLKKTNDSKEETSSELQIKESKVRMLENQLIFVRGELEQRETQVKRYKSVHDNLETQNKKMRQEVSDLTFRLKEEEQLTISQSKKSRQQMTKYETRLTNIKRQFQKFKENLRSVLVESIISQLSRDQQEKQITLRRREAKLGLTLTNQLLIKLQEYLKELSRHKSETQAKLRATEKELITSREQIILKTNQYQNTEGQLKFKLDELIDNLEKMKNIYSEREQQLRKAISDLQWQLSLKDNQVQKISISLKDVTETQQRDAIIANDNFSRNEKSLCSEIEKLRAKLNESSEREAAYFGQITTLEEYITGIESSLNNSDNKIVLLEQQLDRKQKEQTESVSQIQNLKQTVSDLSKQKSQLKNVLLSYESEIQQNKLLINQYKTQIAALQKEKNQQSIMIRSLMKEKESFLHQYLASEEKIFHFETRQFQLEEKISALEEQRQKDAKTFEETRKKSAQEAKSYETNLTKKQTERESQVRRLEEKLKQKEKVVNLLSQRITSTEELLSQLRLKLDASNKASQSRENDLHESIIRLQQQHRQSLFQNQVLSKKSSELESQLRKHRESIEQLNISIEELNKTLTQYITANNKLEAELFSNKSELTQIREDYVKIKDELQEKDLQNYEISSNFFKNEMELAEKIDHLQQKVAMQEESMIKYQEICEDYAAEIEALKKSNQTLTSINAQSQAEIARTLAKCKQANQEIQSNYETIRQLEQQLRRSSYLRKEKFESSYGSTNLSLQRGGELGI